MADRLTQLQDALDQLATQFYASLRYLSLHAPPRIPTSLQPPADPAAPPPRPDSPSTFLAAQKELARDILLQEAQIEVLISSLPGIERGEAEQVKRLQELEAELKEAEREREQAVREMSRWLKGVEEVIEGVRRGANE